MKSHSMSCEYPEGCSCGATKWNERERELMKLRLEVSSKEVDVNEYQEWIRETAQYPGGVTYPICGVTAEAGELMNDLIRMQRKHHRLDISEKDLTSAARLKLKDEAGDVLNYLTMLANELGLSLDQIASFNKTKLELKIAAGEFYRTEVNE